VALLFCVKNNTGIRRKTAEITFLKNPPATRTTLKNDFLVGVRYIIGTWRTKFFGEFLVRFLMLFVELVLGMSYLYHRWYRCVKHYFFFFLSLRKHYLLLMFFQTRHNFCNKLFQYSLFPKNNNPHTPNDFRICYVSTNSFSDRINHYLTFFSLFRTKSVCNSMIELGHGESISKNYVFSRQILSSPKRTILCLFSDTMLTRKNFTKSF
jgi:hypothetical protein